MNNPFKQNKHQEAIIVTGVGGMVDNSLDFMEGKGCATNEKLNQAWAVDAENQVLDRATGKRIQLLTALSPNPIRLFGPEKDKITKENLNALASRVVDEEIAWDDEKHKKNVKTLIVAGLAFILVMAVVVPFLRALLSGQAKLPFFGG